MAVLTAEQVYAAARGAGATHEEAVTLTAIAKGESGWNTGAHNPDASTGDNSYGLWQINMLGAKGPTRLKLFGITRNEDLFDPRVNARAALTLLRGRSKGGAANYSDWTIYNSGAYKQYLPEATAAGNKWRNDWQSPAQGLNRDWGADAVAVANSGGAPAAPAPARGTSISTAGVAPAPRPSLPPNATPAQISEYINRYYPQAAPFLAIPEIAAIFTDPAAGEMDSIEIEAKLRATTYWQTNGPDSRAFDALRGSDNQAANQLINQTKRTLSDLFARNGVTLTSEQAGAYALRMIRGGYVTLDGQVRDADAINDLVAAEIGKGPLAAGEASNTADGMIAKAKQFLVPVSRKDAEAWSLRVLSGTASEESFQSWLTGLAKARFASQPDILAALDSGLSPSQYFAGHRNAVAGLLEVDDSQIDLIDPKWSWMIETVDKNGNRRAPTLGEVQQLARDRPEFAGTRAYKETSAGYAMEMSKFLGAAS